MSRATADRVGGARFTGLGAVMLAVLLFAATQQPDAADRQTLALVLVALVMLLAVGIIWPQVAVRRITVAATSPRDGTVGVEVPIEVSVAGRFTSCEVRLLDPTSPWHRVGGHGRGSIDHLADRRGVFPALRIEVRVTAPVGIWASHRVHTVPLPVPVAIAPRPLDVDWLEAPAPLPEGTAQRAPVNLGGDLARSVRPYVAGDPSHLVHWPTSARTGSMVVREMEPPSPLGQAIVVDLRNLGVETEQAASYAFGAARAVLRRGGQLVLCTYEPDGPVTAPVPTIVEAGRRLAWAVPGVPGAPPEGWPVVEIGR